jgi:hypothetical protein
MTTTTTPTLAAYLKERRVADKKFKVKKTEPASFVPPAYKKKPEAEQIKTGLANVSELTFSDDTVAFMCQDDDRLFANADSARAHRGSAHRKPKDAVEDIKADNPEVEEQQAEAVAKEMAEVILNDVTRSLLKRMGIEEITFEALVQKYFDLVDGFEALKQDNSTLAANLVKAIDENTLLRSIIQDYEEQAFPKHLRVKFIEMMAETMENVGDKWLEIVKENREHHAKVDKIIKS